MILRKLQVTEKSSVLAEKQNKYFFVVAPEATKRDVKQAVENIYKVQVATVNTMNVMGKERRLRTARPGRRPDWKRAVVTLKEGSKIELT